MPRDKQRFSDLQRQLKQGNYSQTSGDAFEYLQYLKGINKLKVERKPDSKYLQRFNVGVIPFDVAFVAADAEKHWQAAMTILADNIRIEFNTVAPIALFGIEIDLSKCEQVNGFYPALARITVKPLSQTTKDEKTSGITKRKYKSFKTRTGSIPFGRSLVGVKQPDGSAETDLGDVESEQVEKSILAALKGTNTTTYQCTGISFVPEEHPAEGYFGKDKPTGNNVPTGIPAN